MDNLEHSISKVLSMLETVSSHVDSVIKTGSATGTVGNPALGRFLMDTVTSIPRIDAAEFDKMFTNHLQDLLMVVYLANLTRTQLAITERLQNLF